MELVNASSPASSDWFLFGFLALPFLLSAIRLGGHRFSIRKWPLYVLLTGTCVFGGLLSAVVVGLISIVVLMLYFSGELGD